MWDSKDAQDYMYQFTLLTGSYWALCSNGDIASKDTYMACFHLACISPAILCNCWGTVGTAAMAIHLHYQGDVPHQPVSEPLLRVLVGIGHDHGILPNEKVLFKPCPLAVWVRLIARRLPLSEGRVQLQPHQQPQQQVTMDLPNHPYCFPAFFACTESRPDMVIWSRK